MTNRPCSDMSPHAPPPHNSTSLVFSDSLVPTDYKTNLLSAISWFRGAYSYQVPTLLLQKFILPLRLR